MRRRLAILVLGMVFGIFGYLTKASATNGDNLIGLSPASRAMGGTGVAVGAGPTDAVIRNPALLTENQRFTASFGGILFLPDVSAKFKMGPQDSGWKDSKSSFFVIPEIALVQRINQKIVAGIGAYGVSGMGVDYREEPMLSKMHTNFSFMRFVPAVGIELNDKLSVGAGLHIAWGSLDMGATMCANATNPSTCWNASGGVFQTVKPGFSLGIHAKLTKNIWTGVAYQSSTKLTYERVFDTNGDGTFEDLELEQPQEVAFGAGVVTEKFRAAFDVRWINWSGAAGYDAFKWEDQWVFALGVEFRPNEKLALRAGYNYGKTPIREKSGLNALNLNDIPNFSAPFPDFNVEWFNLVGFPAIAEHHITCGFEFFLTKNFSVNFAYVFVPESEVITTGTFYDSSSGYPAEVGARNAQHSFAFSVDWHY